MENQPSILMQILSDECALYKQTPTAENFEKIMKMVEVIFGDKTNEFLYFLNNNITADLLDDLHEYLR